MDLEEIKAEIKRRRDESMLGTLTTEKGIIFDEMDSLLSFIESSKEEDDLEKEINTYINNQGLSDLSERLSNCARHFAEWGKTYMKKQIIKRSEDEKYCRDGGAFGYKSSAII